MIERRIAKRPAAGLQGEAREARDARGAREAAEEPVAPTPAVATSAAGASLEDVPPGARDDNARGNPELSPNMLFAAIEQLDELVLFIRPGAADAPPQITFANAAVERMLGVTPAAMTAHYASDATSPALLALRDLIARQLDADRCTRHEVSWTSPAGCVHCLNITATPCRKPGERRLSHWAVVARDVTQQQALTHRSAQAQRLESLGLIAGSIAHDFNNLVHVVTGFSELALRQLPANSASTMYIQQAHEAALRAASMAKQLLAFSRRQSVKAVRVDVRSIVRDLQPVLARIAGSRIPLSLVVGAEPAMVCADPTQLEQILLNLVVNARDAQPNGGSLQIALHLREGTGRNTIELRVIDAGAGMSPEVQQRVFEPFFTTKSHGTGLGLATVHRVVSEAGGTVTFESPPGAGLTVVVTLPEADAE